MRPCESGGTQPGEGAEGGQRDQQAAGAWQARACTAAPPAPPLGGRNKASGAADREDMDAQTPIPKAMPQALNPKPMGRAYDQLCGHQEAPFEASQTRMYARPLADVPRRQQQRPRSVEDTLLLRGLQLQRQPPPHQLQRLATVPAVAAAIVAVRLRTIGAPAPSARSLAAAVYRRCATRL